LITIAMSTVIRGDRARVWRALTDPAEVVGWDETLIAPIVVTPDYPKPGQHVRWRSQLNGLPVILHDRPIEVSVGERLRSNIAHGLFRFDETYSLADDPVEAGRTRLMLKIVASNEIPVVGGALDRFAVRQYATELASSALRAIRAWCERPPD
jgi:hypothetical protein